MSHVTDIILTTALWDGSPDDSPYSTPNADTLSAYLVAKYGPANALNEVSEGAGGGKAFQADGFMAAVNYCDIAELVATFRAIKWVYPESAQLFVKDEYEDKFRIYNADDAL